MRIESLEDEGRAAQIRVAGAAALLIAKTHKLGDRIEAGRRDRLSDKDAADVVRLIQDSSPIEVATKLKLLIEHPSAGEPTEMMLDVFRPLFGSRGGTGIAMAVEAMRGAMPADRIRAICLAFSDALYESIEQ